MQMMVFTLLQPSPKISAVWTTKLEIAFCGGELRWFEIYPPKVERPVVSRSLVHYVQWVHTPEPGKQYYLADVIREMSEDGYWKYVVLVRSDNGMGYGKTLWVTPYGVAFDDPGPPPEKDGDWEGWALKHRWIHKHFMRQFQLLWYGRNTGLTYKLTLRIPGCEERGESIAS